MSEKGKASSRSKVKVRHSSAASSSASRVNSSSSSLGPRTGFSRGAIIKLYLHNFLTFDDVVLHPTPQLNLIIAPNGTGKSSLVCAMCLGLGGQTSLLGRARDLKDFVKHGEESGFVEITLFDDRSTKHPVIRRTLFANDNSSEWTINGGTARGKDVKALVESLNVQLDNRCMFLPQDKVVEFARMNKQELLVETERAIGPKELSKYHEELKSLKLEQSQSHDILRRKQQELENLERQNRLLDRDVKRFKDKQNYLRDIKQLTFKKYWVQYEEAKADFDKKKEERKQASKELKRLKEIYQPIRERHKEQEDAVNRHKEKAQKTMSMLHQVEKRVRDHKEKFTSLEDKLEEPKQELENTRKLEESRKKKIIILQKEIEGFQRALEDLEPADSLNSKIAEKNRILREIQQKMSVLTEEQSELRTKVQQEEDSLRRAEEELREMNDVWNQRFERLKGRESATTRVIKWLKVNQHRFRQPIFEPVCMLLNILNPRYAKQVEAFFTGKDFLSFIAQNEDDRETFLREVRDNMKLKVNIVRAPERPLSDYTPAIPFRTLQDYGFEEMLLNVVAAPDPVLCFFCQYHHLHDIPIAGNLRPRDIDRITSQLVNLRSFFTVDMRYSVKKSLYRNATSTRSNELYPPRFLVASVDVQKKEHLERQVSIIKNTLAQYSQNYRQLEGRGQQLRQEDTHTRTEKQELRKVTESHKAHKANITTRQKKLEQHLATTYNIKEAEEKCEQAVSQIQRDRVVCLGELKSLIRRAITNTDESIQATLSVHTAEAKVSFFLRQFREAKTAYDDAEQKVSMFQIHETASKEKAGQLLSRARKETGQLTDELLASFRMFPDQLEAIEDRIHELSAQAEMCIGVDRSVVEQYKEREKKIENLNAEISNKMSSMDEYNQRIQTMKEKWLTPLNELIEKINVRFRSYFSSHTQMDCAGEVRLDPDPKVDPDFSNFDMYGVQIKVKFRDNEQLQELNAQRQSGGERSVSTMLYLMALQENTSCPFRVVDEINQGMDPVNERHIFDLIVKSACHGAQYFLLSPKLLHNLEYSEAVTVHIVFNGQEMMNCRDWNMKKFLS